MIDSDSCALTSGTTSKLSSVDLTSSNAMFDIHIKCSGKIRETGEQNQGEGLHGCSRFCIDLLVVLKEWTGVERVSMCCVSVVLKLLGI